MRVKYIQNKYMKKIYRGKVKFFSRVEVDEIINDLVNNFSKEKIIQIANE